MNKKIFKYIGIALVVILLLLVVMVAYVYISGPVTDCDSCLNGTSP